MNEKPVRFGPRKLGKEAYEAQKAKESKSSRQGTVYGGRKGQKGVEAAPRVAPDVTPQPTKNPFIVETGEKTERVPIGEVEALLEQNPILLDLAIETELSFDSPRKGAVKVFRELEQKRAEGPRTSVMKLLAPLG